MSRKIIATLDTANFNDCTARGYSWTLYADGRLAAEYHSRWQGTRDGARWTTDADAVDLSGLDPDDPDNDALARLTAAVEDLEPEYDSRFRQTRKGHLVR